MNVIFCEGTPGDRRFVAASWVASYWNAQRHLRRAVYVRGQHDRIGRMLDSPEVRVLVARPEEWDDEGIAGYIVYTWPRSQDVGAIHWWLVKKPFRRSGVGRGLLEGARAALGEGAVYTHHPVGSMAEALWRRDIYYDPYWLDRAGSEGVL